MATRKRRNKNGNRAEALKIAASFRTKIFFDKKEADDFYNYASKEGLSYLQMWMIPDTPTRYRIIWFEEDENRNNAAGI